MTYRYMMRRGLTLRMVPKKSSTNFWTVPFVDSNRVRKISGMDLQQHVIIILILIIILIIIIIIIITESPVILSIKIFVVWVGE